MCSKRTAQKRPLFDIYEQVDEETDLDLMAVLVDRVAPPGLDFVNTEVTVHVAYFPSCVNSLFLVWCLMKIFQ